MRRCCEISWTNLRRDRVAQALTFLLPIVFFSIFATVFGNQGNASTARIRVAVVDEDDSELSRRIVAGLRDGEERCACGRRRTRKARARRSIARPPRSWCATATCRSRSFCRRIRRGRRGVRTVAAAAPQIQLLADVSDPIAPQMVCGLLQKVAMTAAPDLLMQGGLRQFERYAGALTPQQRAAVDALAAPADAGSARRDATTSDSAATGVFGIGIDIVDVMRQGNRESLDLVLRRGHRRDVPAVLDVAARAARCSTRSSPARSSACSRRASA